MDQFFRPTRRYQDLYASLDSSQASSGGDGHEDDDFGFFEYTEKELAVPVEEFLVCNLDWKYLWDFLTGAGVPQKILWITEDAFLVVESDEDYFHFHDDDPVVFLEPHFREQAAKSSC
jgi:hypothetical protein